MHFWFEERGSPSFVVFVVSSTFYHHQLCLAVSSLRLVWRLELKPVRRIGLQIHSQQATLKTASIDWSTGVRGRTIRVAIRDGTGYCCC